MKVANQKNSVIVLCFFAVIVLFSAFNFMLTGCGNINWPFPSVSPADSSGTSSWWNSSYSYRKQLTITASTDALSSGYSVNFTFDHAALVTAGKSLSSGDDIRIVYWDGATNTEIDRIIDNSSSWNNASTKIWFKTQIAIAVSTSDNGYYLYYGNSGASSPPADGDNVYEFWDDFEDGDISDWTQYGGGTVQLANDGGNNVLLKTDNSDPDGGYSTFNNGALGNLEVIFNTNRINENGGAQNRYGIEDSSFNGYGPRMYSFGGTDTFAIEQRTGGNSDGNLTSTTFTSNQLVWYRVEFRRYENNLEFELYEMNGTLVQSVSTTDSTYTSFDRFIVHGGYEFYTDNILVRKYVSSDSSISVSAGSEESL